MNKKTIIVLSSIIGGIILIGIIVFILININKSNNTTLDMSQNENTQNIIGPSIKAKISQGQLPVNSLMNYLPSFTVGTIGDVIESDQGISITILNLELQDYQYYISLTQENGFVNNIDTSSTTNVILYSSRNNDNILLRTSYSTETKKMSLVISAEE